MSEVFKFELGVTGKDVITGVEGVLVGRVQYLTGCTQYLVQPQGAKSDGSPKESHWFDEAKLQQVGKKRLTLADAPNGGPQRNEPPRR